MTTSLAWLEATLTEISPAPLYPDPLEWPGYEAGREAAVDTTGADEAVQTYVAAFDDTTHAVLIIFNFSFLGGSMGADVGWRVCEAFRLATGRRLPVITIAASGGARMQEGLGSLAQMPATVAAAAQHAAAGLGTAVWLRHPSTGGVWASFTNRADVLLAEPEATIGFAGPRVARAFGGDVTDSHTAEHAANAGLVDGLLAESDAGEQLTELVRWLDTAAAPVSMAPPPAAQGSSPAETISGSAAIHAVRDTDRLRADSYLAHDHVRLVQRLAGDRAGVTDDSMTTDLAWLGPQPVVVIAQRRLENAPGPGPAAYRVATRGVRLATRLGVPVVTLIDTPGARTDSPAENRGIANAIAELTDALLTCDAPVVAVVIGEGGSGGALALAAADRVLMHERATFQVIAPEGAAAILYRDPTRADEVADLMQPTAQRLAADGFVDEVLPDQDVDRTWMAVQGHIAASALLEERAVSRQDRWIAATSG